MNYLNIYNSIIQKALQENRVKGQECYYETHHIVPRCLGGSNSRSNLVNLKSREHFICHMLLCEMYPDSKELGYALWCMCNQKSGNQLRHRPSSRVYERARKLRHKLPSPLTSESWKRAVIGNAKRSAKISKALSGVSKGKGVVKSELHKHNIAKALSGKKKSHEAIINSVEAKRLAREFKQKQNLDAYHFEHLNRHTSVDVMRSIIESFQKGTKLGSLQRIYGKSYETLRKILAIEGFLREAVSNKNFPPDSL